MLSQPFCNLIILDGIKYTIIFCPRKRWRKLIKFWEDWGRHKSWPKHSHICTFDRLQRGARLGGKGCPQRIFCFKFESKNRQDSSQLQLTWHRERDVELSEIIRSQHIQNVINNKWNLELAKETELVLTWEHRCFVFGIPRLAHEASRHAQYNLMNLLGRPQIDYLTGALCRKCQRLANCSAMYSWERRYTLEHYWLYRQSNSLLCTKAQRDPLRTFT